MRQAAGDYDAREGGFELVGEERHGDYSRPERRVPAMFLSVLLMAVFAGGLWFAYHFGARHAAPGQGGGEVPLIRADTSPDKIKPDQPGGMKVPDQNASIFNEKPGIPRMERLLPPPEKPMPRPAPPPPPPAPVAAPSPAAPQPATPSRQASLRQAPDTPERASEPEERSEAASPAAEAARRPAATAAKAGGIQVRLGSLRSSEAARAEWQRLKHDNPDLLGHLTAVAVRTDLGEKGIYYRIEAGPFAEAAAAEKLCGEMKRRNFGCILGH
jgi:hypothetical protein